MKKLCKLEVKSIRSSILEAEFSPDTARDFWEQVEADGVLPEELYDTDTSDRIGDEMYMEPEFAENGESVLTSTGTVEKTKDGTVRISYEDSEITGLPGCLTTFCLVPDGSVILLRHGDVRTCMIFRSGTRQTCEYGSDGTMPAITLHTHEANFELGSSCGRLYVKYSVEIRGTLVEQNEIDLSVWFSDEDGNF